MTRFIMMLLCCALLVLLTLKTTGASPRPVVVTKNSVVDTPDKDGNTPLMLAAKKGDLARMKTLLSSGADLHKRNPRGSTALMFAVDGGLPAVELLLKKGAKVNDQRYDGMGALSWVVVGNHAATFERLLAAGASPNILDDRQHTLLHFAAYKGHVALVKRLLELKLNPDALDSYSETPLMIAAENGHVEVVRLLVARKANLSHWNADSETALVLAAKKGHLAVVKELVQAGVSLKGKEGDRAVSLAVESKKPAVVRYLLDKGADLNAKGFFGRPLVSLAAWTRQPELAIELLKRGADPNLRSNGGSTPLEMAVFWTESPALVQTIFKRGVKPDHEATLDACGTQKPDVLKQFLAVGADLSITGKSLKDSSSVLGVTGGSCLHVAAMKASPEVVTWLLQETRKQRRDGKRLDTLLVQMQDNYGTTPLMDAARREKGSAAVVKLLIEAGSPLDIKDGSGNTALHQAAEHGNVDTIRLLLQKGAHIQKGQHDRTPMELALARGKLDAALTFKDQKPSAAMLQTLFKALAEDRDGAKRLNQALQQYSRQLTPELLASALFAAVSEDRLENARILLQHKAQPNGIGKLDTESQRYLQVLLRKHNLPDDFLAEPAVAALKSVAMAELLSRYHADFNQSDSKGVTALQQAVRSENLALVRWLINKKVDVNKANKRGSDPLALARYGGLPELISLLEKAGAQTTFTSPVLWASSITEKENKTLYGFASGPLLVGNLVIIGHEDGYLYAFDKANGSLRWKRHLGGEIKHTPRLVDGDLFVTADSHTLIRIRPKDGSVVWQFAYSGKQVAGGAQFWRDLALVADYQGGLWAVDRASGKLRWERNLGELEAVVRNEDGLRIVGDGAYFLNKQGVNRYDLISGKLSNFNIKNAGMPEVADGLAFVPTKDKELHVLDAVTLQPKQKVVLGAAALVRPLLHNSRLIVSVEGGLQAFRVRPALLRKIGFKPLGNLVWQRETNIESYARPVIDKYWLVAYSLEPENTPQPGITSIMNLVTLLSLDPQTGQEHDKVPLWESYLYGDRMVTPAVDDTIVYAAPLGPNKRVQAVKLGLW
ncbi:ankyrin repeat domain-containing protein [Trichlorobacter lovleyi]|uniref:ankyrin repeat domain-containing protein n=1 Tax=Trichlorobacter lovleyi TaxID=313985 RepID=UPI0022402017|nr:ankyrin repeat domain-containing protein [Trichlorobacter lovleyi]QOX79867.1 ankyrin repeat domain-containing protein [Trichlorobacter lovleyi]